MPVTFKLREIGVLRARDMPEVKVVLVEDPEPEGPFGAKGVGEIGLVPTAAAVAGALEAFDGVRRYRLPMKDSPAARAMCVGRDADRDRRRCPDSSTRTPTLQRPGAVRDAGTLARRPDDFLQILERVWWRARPRPRRTLAAGIGPPLRRPSPAGRHERR